MFYPCRYYCRSAIDRSVGAEDADIVLPLADGLGYLAIWRGLAWMSCVRLTGSFEQRQRLSLALSPPFLLARFLLGPRPDSLLHAASPEGLPRERHTLQHVRRNSSGRMLLTGENRSRNLISTLERRGFQEKITQTSTCSCGDGGILRRMPLPPTIVSCWFFPCCVERERR